MSSRDYHTGHHEHNVTEIQYWPSSRVLQHSSLLLTLHSGNCSSLGTCRHIHQHLLVQPMRPASYARGQGQRRRDDDLAAISRIQLFHNSVCNDFGFDHGYLQPVLEQALDQGRPNPCGKHNSSEHRQHIDIELAKIRILTSFSLSSRCNTGPIPALSLHEMPVRLLLMQRMPHLQCADREPPGLQQ